jgi:hypothetical protein
MCFASILGFLWSAPTHSVNTVCSLLVGFVACLSLNPLGGGKDVGTETAGGRGQSEEIGGKLYVLLCLQAARCFAAHWLLLAISCGSCLLLWICVVPFQEEARVLELTAEVERKKKEVCKKLR